MAKSHGFYSCMYLDSIPSLHFHSRHQHLGLITFCRDDNNDLQAAFSLSSDFPSQYILLIAARSIFLKYSSDSSFPYLNTFAPTALKKKNIPRPLSLSFNILCHLIAKKCLTLFSLFSIHTHDASTKLPSCYCQYLCNIFCTFQPLLLLTILTEIFFFPSVNLQILPIFLGSALIDLPSSITECLVGSYNQIELHLLPNFSITYISLCLVILISFSLSY